MRRIDIHPKVFISHASEDKERFVRAFATKLRQEAGVDAWVDEWEIYPGDSLIQKIFEEGLKEAEAVIIVLSEHSVDKPWVREELDASIIKKVEDVTRLLPVIIDDCEVPEALRSTVWQRIENLDDYSTEFDRIVAAIYGHRDKPELGLPPKYSQTAVDKLPGLTSVDTLVLKLSCEKAIEDVDYFIQTQDVWEQVDAVGVPLAEFNDSLEVLHGQGYIRMDDETLGSADESPLSYTIQLRGFEEYARAFVENYESIVDSVAFHVVNHAQEARAGSLNSEDITEELRHPKMIVNHILKLLERKGFIEIMVTDGTNVWIMGVSAELRRRLSG
jgi:hypothetical protein